MSRHFIHLDMNDDFLTFTLHHEGDDFTECGTWKPGHDGPDENGELDPRCFLVDYFDCCDGLSDMFSGQIVNPSFPLEVTWCNSDAPQLHLVPAVLPAKAVNP